MDADIQLDRTYLPNVTLGILQTQNNFSCCTLELPWLNNQSKKSCIPPGVYEYFIRRNASRGTVIELLDVPDRTNVQIHAGNWTSDSLGCILVGTSLALQAGTRPMVRTSNPKLKALLSTIPERGYISIK